MSQIVYFPAQDRLGQKMRHERTVPIEVFTYIAEEHDVAPLVNEHGLLLAVGLREPLQQLIEPGHDLHRLG
jgi:hypothetical protein